MLLTPRPERPMPDAAFCDKLESTAPRPPENAPDEHRPGPRRQASRPARGAVEQVRRAAGCAPPPGAAGSVRRRGPAAAPVRLDPRPVQAVQASAPVSLAGGLA